MPIVEAAWRPGSGLAQHGRRAANGRFFGGLWDAGSLEAALARLYAGYGDTELFPSPFDRATALVESAIRRHPFVDGNKRTGLLAGAALLYLAGYGLVTPRDEMVEVPVALAERRIGAKELSRWFEANAERRQ